MSKQTVGIVRFPGSNCEQDSYEAVVTRMGMEALYLWHDSQDLQRVDFVILPGGFSYGDYLRSGAIARFSPIMREVVDFARRGGPVLGICNGFQILTEAGLLPGTLIRNANMRFVCERHVPIRVVNANTLFTKGYGENALIHLPVAHGDGNYTVDPETLERLEGNGQVVFRYERDINGSVNQIAGIINEKGNVLGMMPHPERNLNATDLGRVWTGDGAQMFDALAQGLQTLVAVS